MATPSADHYMRQYTTAQLRAIVADPRHYGVGERLDADAILRERDMPAAHGERYRRADGTCGCDLCRFDPAVNVAAMLRYGD